MYLVFVAKAWEYNVRIIVFKFPKPFKSAGVLVMAIIALSV